MGSLPAVLQNLTWLDFDPSSNCEWAGELFAHLYTGNLDDEPSVGDLAGFAYTCAPFSLRSHNVTGGHIVDFNTRNILAHNGTLGELQRKIQVDQVCHYEFCRNAKWEGNPDLSGIGVLTAYILQCAMTTLFYAVGLTMDLRTSYEYKASKVAGTMGHDPPVQ